MNDKKINKGFDEFIKTLDLEDRYVPTVKDRLAYEKEGFKRACIRYFDNFYYRNMVADFMSEGKMPVMPEDEYSRGLIKRGIERMITKSPYILLTINPRPEIELEEFKKPIEKFVGRKIIDSYAYVYEVRKEDHSGLHCHILLQYNCKPYDFKRNAKSTFKHVCDINNPSILNIKYVDHDKLELKYAYLLGEKKDSKLKGVEYTKEFRKQNKLDEIYESTPCLPCRGAEKKVIETKP